MTTRERLVTCSLVSGISYVLLALIIDPSALGVHLSILAVILLLATVCITIVLVRTAGALFESMCETQQKLWTAQQLIKDIRFNKYDKITQERVDNYLKENKVP